MRNLNYIGLFFRTMICPLLPQAWQRSIQKGRIRELVAYSKRNSPFFARHYRDIGSDFNLTDLPVTTKQMMMENFDEWVTDPDVRLDRVREFMSDRKNLDRKNCGKYMAVTTSGSTGTPAILLHDRRMRNVATVVSCLRTRVLRFPMCNIFVDDDFGVSNGTIRQNLVKFPFLKRFMRIVNAKMPMEMIVRELNALRPRVINGYPGTLELLADEALEGRLTIRPSLIFVSGEHLTQKVREKLQNAFRCTVHTIYACTEGGTMAFECRMNRLHVNTDWCLLEPVNERGEPVPYGVQSHKVLLTNLANAIQPIIRYELTDRVILRDDSCPCGKRGPWLEVEGRTSDVIWFEANGRKIGVAPMALYDVIEVVPGVKHFQVVLRSDNCVELRLVCMKHADRAKTFELVKTDMLRYLGGLGIPDADVILSDLGPQMDQRSGKFKQIYQVFDAI